MLKSELNAIGITDTAAMPLQKALGGLSRHKFIASSLIKKTSETSIYQYRYLTRAVLRFGVPNGDDQ